MRQCLAVLGIVGCLMASSGCGVWGNDDARRARANQQPELDPTLVQLSADDFASQLAETPFSPRVRKDLDRLRRLSEIFYGQLLNRRINSKAAFDDPSLREFFENSESFADYYADLVQALADRHFEAIRPTAITLRSYKVEESANRVFVEIRFVGESRLPLRFWKTTYLREDIWVISGNRWWIVPGKV